MRILLLIISFLIIVQCSTTRTINHPLVVHYTNGTKDTCYFQIPPRHHFEIIVDDHFNFSWLVIVPDGYNITEEMWRDKRTWLKRNVVKYELLYSR